LEGLHIIKRISSDARPSERAEQIALHEWCKAKRLNSFAIPNGGSRHKLEAANMKREGVTSGVSDYCVILDHVVLFIEMKKRAKILKTGQRSISGLNISDNQYTFLTKVNKTDVCTGIVAYGAKEAIEFIERNL